MPRSGTLVICTQNLDFSGANQVILNIVQGTMHEGNIVILSPVLGPFASRFVQLGAAIRTGTLLDVLRDIRDVFCILCNTIMTAPIVVEMSRRPQPIIWILHEWWDDKMIVENLSMRNISGMTVDTVKEAMKKASKIVFVCEGQKKLYNPSSSSTVIYVGVPKPLVSMNKLLQPKETKQFIFLSLGIVCPRKNQVWAVKLFKKFAKDRKDVKLLIVGARHIRSYEIEYLEEVTKEIDGDERIELHDVTDDVDQYYDVTDVLLFTSLNEVTPMVISEAMSYGIPIISTNIAGIPEMIRDGMEGFLMNPDDDDAAVNKMNQLFTDEDLRYEMGQAGIKRFQEIFDLNIMVDRYRRVIFEVCPPVVLVDMDGVLVDWDAGFNSAWNNRSEINRELSYHIELCCGSEHFHAAELLYHSQGFFEGLPPMAGAIAAMEQMVAEGLQVYICTTPVLTSHYCAQEKINWVRSHLGECWLDKLILGSDKTKVRGDILIDDKPLDLLAPEGTHTTATWKQVVFDAPYNQQCSIPRLKSWGDWRTVILPLLGKKTPEDPYLLEYGVPTLSPINRSIKFPLQENEEEEVHSVDDLLDAFKDSLAPDDDVKSVTLTDDSDAFLEDFRDMRKDMEMCVSGKPDGLEKLKQSLNQRAKDKLRDIEREERRVAISDEGEDSMDSELFRKSYRQWRLEVFNARNKSPI